MPTFGSLIPRLRRPFGGILDPLPFRGETPELAGGPFTGGARLQPLSNVNEGFASFNPPPAPAPVSIPAPRPQAPLPTPRPQGAPSPSPMGQPQGGGLLGKIGGMDPLTLAMFMAPIAEMLKHGSGSALYSAALQGKAQRADEEERRAEREHILKERADRQLTEQEEREIRRREREEDRADRDEERDFRREEAEARRAQRLAPREETPSEKLAREKFEYEKGRDEQRKATGDEKPADRMKRIRTDIENLTKGGTNSPAVRQRIKQYAAIIGVDPRVYLDRLDASAKQQGVKTANIQARTNRANRPLVRAGRPASRGGRNDPLGIR